MLLPAIHGVLCRRMLAQHVTCLETRLVLNGWAVDVIDTAGFHSMNDFQRLVTQDNRKRGY